MLKSSNEDNNEMGVRVTIADNNKDDRERLTMQYKTLRGDSFSRSWMCEM